MKIEFDCKKAIVLTEMALDDVDPVEEKNEYESYIRDMEFYTSVMGEFEIESLDEYCELLSEAENHCNYITVENGGRLITLNY